MGMGGGGGASSSAACCSSPGITHRLSCTAGGLVTDSVRLTRVSKKLVATWSEFRKHMTVQRGQAPVRFSRTQRTSLL